MHTESESFSQKLVIFALIMIIFSGEKVGSKLTKIAIERGASVVLFGYKCPWIMYACVTRKSSHHPWWLMFIVDDVLFPGTSCIWLGATKWTFKEILTHCGLVMQYSDIAMLCTKFHFKMIGQIKWMKLCSTDIILIKCTYSHLWFSQTMYQLNSVWCVCKIPYVICLKHWIKVKYSILPKQNLIHTRNKGILTEGQVHFHVQLCYNVHFSGWFVQLQGPHFDHNQIKDWPVDRIRIINNVSGPGQCLWQNMRHSKFILRANLSLFSRSKELVPCLYCYDHPAKRIHWTRRNLTIKQITVLWHQRQDWQPSFSFSTA